MPSVLLHMPLKAPPRNDLVQPLASWLDDDDQHVGFSASYSNNHNSNNDNDDKYEDAPPSSWIVPKPAYSSVECRKELLRLASLRNCLSESLLTFKDALEDNALQDCQDYHATLLAFEKQGFPSFESSSSSGGEQHHQHHTRGMDLTWRGAFPTAVGGKQQHQLETHHALVWDRVGCLWNVAALQSYQAATLCDLASKEGCKSAISLLQSASNILTTLKEIMEQQQQQQDYATVDYSTGMLRFWETLFKAQAQYVIYKMANLGDSSGGTTTTTRQHTTLGYLVQAAAGLYNEALEWAKDPRLQSEVTTAAKNWATHCKAQSLVCQARATFHISIDHRLKQDHGLELARLSQCVTQLKECQDFGRSAGQDMAEVQGLVQLATDRLERARMDNDTIYVDRIPTDLSDIRPQIMVKSHLPLPAAMLQPRVPLFEWCHGNR